MTVDAPGRPTLGIVIPTLNAAPHLGRTLAAVGAGDSDSDSGSEAEAGDAGQGRGLAVADILVVDGGSHDETAAMARAAGARVMAAPRGRGPQLAAGAETVAGDWILFLHADSVPQAGWRRAVAAFATDPANRGRAAAFRFVTDLDSPWARAMERYVAWRCAALGLPYGDQGLLVARDTYRSAGGFRPLPVMEDVDLVRRLGRGRVTVLDVAAVTSGDRYRRAGVAARGARNLACLGLYFLGVPPRAIARLYG